MDTFFYKKLGKSNIKLPKLGFGAAPLGELFEKVSEEQSSQTLNTSYDSGFRYYDTAPWYGHGLSEHRIGSLLRNKLREEYIISSKVGRVYKPFKEDYKKFNRSPWVGGLNFQYKFDYTYSGFERSFEDSTCRLGINQIDLLVIHDLDNDYHGDLLSNKFKELESGFIWLKSMRDLGHIKAIGVGINDAQLMSNFYKNYDIDFFLVAMPYTLINQETLDEIFPECKKRGIGIIIGAPFSSGILATGVTNNAKYNYRKPSKFIVTKVNSIKNICDKHNVPLKAAAIQFPLFHPLVTTVIPGMLNPDQVKENILMMQYDIPIKFWHELKNLNLIHPDSPIS